MVKAEDDTEADELLTMFDELCPASPAKAGQEADDTEPELLPLPAMAIQEDSDPITADVVDASLIFYGLDNAGKSTIMQLLTNDRLAAQQPTLHPSSLEVVIDKVRFRAIDLAGHETGRRLWKEYFHVASAVFFLVDAADPSRFAEAAEELQCLLSAPALKAVPIAVLGMKTDLKGAANEDDFCKAMGLAQETLSDHIKVFMCSVVEMHGCHRIGEAILWLSKKIIERNVPQPSAATTRPEALPQDDEAENVDMLV
jgi:GTP-binding protein SAR1